ncbi:MAG TPA: diacylglycerol kinase family protein [Candidatus Krumholzibacteria bacterium]|nr:diacylglycerol kinase family protein [Candidatus Krumholzibacteria bacterium]
MRVSFIANPTAGRGRTRSMVEGFARALPGESQLLWTQGPRHASELARTAAGDSDVVCVVGGDGTVSEVVNGLMPRPVPIVVVPTGSGNDFASMAGAPRSAAELAAVITAGMGRRLDVIDCGDRWCANSIGIGFEALVTYHSLAIRNLRGLPLYLLAVIKALASYESIRYSITIDDAPAIEGDYLLVSAANGPRAGGGFYLNPSARPDDGLIDLLTAVRMPRWRMLSILPRTLRGAHTASRGLTFRRGARVTIAAARPFPIHIDGEYLGRRDTPLVMSVVPRCLPVLCTAGASRATRTPLEKIL